MPKVRRSRAHEDRPLAQSIGQQIRGERLREGLTQTELAGDRYTKSYVSALENGHVKPSMAALSHFADRLGVTVDRLLGPPDSRWTRLEADLRLAAGQWREAADAYEALLPGASGPTRAELLRGLAEAKARQDLGSEAVRAGAEAAALFEARGRMVDAAWSRYWEAFGLYQLEQSHRAKQLLSDIVNDVDSHRFAEPDLQVRALIALGMVESRDDEPEGALAHLEAARGLAEQLDDRRRATFLFSLALSYRELGDLEAAIHAGMQALALFRAASAALEVGSLDNEMALAYLALGNVRRAREFAAAARTQFEELQNDRWLAHVVETAAQVELAAGEPSDAMALAMEARRLAEMTTNRKAYISASVTMARAEHELGNEAQSIALLGEAATVAREHARRGQLQAVLGELAEALAANGDMARAFEVSQEALAAGRATRRRTIG